MSLSLWCGSAVLLSCSYPVAPLAEIVEDSPPRSTEVPKSEPNQTSEIRAIQTTEEAHSIPYFVRHPLPAFFYRDSPLSLELSILDAEREDGSTLFLLLVHNHGPHGVPVPTREHVATWLPGLYLKTKDTVHSARLRRGRFPQPAEWVTLPGGVTTERTFLVAPEELAPFAAGLEGPDSGAICLTATLAGTPLSNCVPVPWQLTGKAQSIAPAQETTNQTEGD